MTRPKLRVVQAQQEASAAVEREAASLQNGDGGGTSDGMIARIAKLEAHMEHVRADTGSLKTDVGKLKTDVATLVERVAHLPTKGFIVSATVATLAILGGLSVFGPNLRTALGLH